LYIQLFSLVPIKNFVDGHDYQVFSFLSSNKGGIILTNFQRNYTCP